MAIPGGGQARSHLGRSFYCFGGNLHLSFQKPPSLDTSTGLLRCFFSLCFIFGCAESSLSLGSFSGCGDRGPLFVAVCGLLTAAASLVVVHGLQGTRASAVAAGGLSGSSSQALERRPNNRGTRA